MRGPTVTVRESLDRLLSAETGVDLAAMEPNDIIVQRTALREGDASFVGRPEEESPVWVLVTRGRGVVSCSRLLYRVACAWAEDFAAADHLLRPEFLDDLRCDVARSMDAEVRVEAWRILVRDLPSAPDALSLTTAQSGPVVLCAADDRSAARELVAAGAVEYGRLIRMVARR